MRRLSSKISLEIWKEIADRVQYLNMYSFDNYEFNQNLDLLCRFLDDLGICSDILNRYPANLDEIGVASLLEGIYSANVWNDYKKANFYEKINQIDILGIPKMAFRPVGFNANVNDLRLIKDTNSENVLEIKKCLTDGKFVLDYAGEYDLYLKDYHNLLNLRDANFLIDVLLKFNDKYNDYIIDDDSYIVMKNFDGILPIQETIYECKFPGIICYNECLDNYKRQMYLKYFYFQNKNNSVNYKKKLIREINNYHYE